MKLHADPFKFAGATFKVNAQLDSMIPGTYLYHIEDYWDQVYGGSWMMATGNPAALLYAIRSLKAGLPIDDEVVYGKVDGLGYIVHVSELGDIVEQGAE
jgi:hypothetical protein